MIRLYKIRQEDGTVWYGVEEVRDQGWGKTCHPIMYPPHSHEGSRFVPVRIELEEIKRIADELVD